MLVIVIGMSRAECHNRHGARDIRIYHARDGQSRRGVVFDGGHHRALLRMIYLDWAPVRFLLSLCRWRRLRRWVGLADVTAPRTQVQLEKPARLSPSQLISFRRPHAEQQDSRGVAM
jgi:hypothetical protein